MAGGTMLDITMQRFIQAFRTFGNEIEADLAGLHRKFDQDLVGGTRGALRRLFDPFLLNAGAPDVLTYLGRTLSGQCTRLRD